MHENSSCKKKTLKQQEQDPRAARKKLSSSKNKTLKQQEQELSRNKREILKQQAQYLPESTIRSLIHRMQQMSDTEPDEDDKRQWHHLIESLARQIRDAELFLRARTASWRPLNANAWLDIAEVYLESGDAQTALEESGYPLPATVVYRALLDSILRRGKSTIYHHGVRYLKKLDRLACDVDDWKNVAEHQAYVQELRQAHGKKYAFWAKYGDK